MWSIKNYLLLFEATIVVVVMDNIGLVVAVIVAHNLKTGKFGGNVPIRLDPPSPFGYFRLFEF